MLVINYNGNKPTTDYFKYSVQGNNNADTIRFLVSLNQEGLVFDNTYHIYAKVQCDDDGFYDKVELSDVQFDDSENLLIANFSLESKHTSHKQIEVSLCCENINQEIVWQTQIVKVGIANGIPAEQEIESEYPTVLAQLQQQIDELKKGGGGEGSGISSVEIEKIWLTYDDKMSLCKDILGTRIIGSVGNENFINDSTRIWVNFKTTPISQKMEDDVKAGHFAIRLDYPNKSRNRKKFSTLVTSQPQANYGAGVKSYAHNFLEGTQGVSMSSNKEMVLKRSLIFVNEEDIKTNRYGEKYIHKKISLYEYITNTCMFKKEGEDLSINLYPITNARINDYSDLGHLFENYLIDRFVLGIPTTITNGDTVGSYLRFNSVSPMKLNQTVSVFFNPQQQYNLKKMNPAFSCYSPLYFMNHNEIYYLYSPYFVGMKRKFLFSAIGGKYYTMCQNVNSPKGYPSNQNVNKKRYMVAKPRCVIVNGEDYGDKEYPFLKVYPQATQNIRLVCKVIVYTGEELFDAMPIFRMLITQK